MSSLASQIAYRIPLHQLLADIVKLTPPPLMISGLTLDSRQVKQGDLFVAIKGQQENGERFIDSAVESGAVAVLVEEDSLPTLADCTSPVLGIADLKHQLSHIADRFFKHPSQQMEVVGITGTNGKTSCCQFIAQALSFLEIDCGVIGTLGYGAVGGLKKTTNTTPDAIAIQGILAELAAQDIKAVALEVSSHGMDQGRVNGVHFDAAIFTNLSRDHLDYHVDMDSYGASKRKFFYLPGIKHVIINVDDDFGQELSTQLSDNTALYRYAINRRDTDVRATNVECSAKGIRAAIQSPWGDGILSSPLLGRFNLSNLLAVFTLLCAQGTPMARALEALTNVGSVPGRMEKFGGAALPLVVVDYAHTPDALEVALNTLRELSAGQLWCVFGCGGERDRGKRAMMGEVAERLADTLILTNDNPRGEDPDGIVQDILSGLRKPGRAKVEQNRAQAIKLAVNNSAPGDLVLVAGKGHEAWQEIKGARIAFDDAEQVRQALNIRMLEHRG